METRRFLAGFATRRKAELHIHLEGSVAPATLVALSRRNGSGRFPSRDDLLSRRAFGGFRDFLDLYRDVCLELRGPEDYALLARDLVRRLRRERIVHAEVYVSPALVERFGFSWPGVAAAVEGVFARHERAGFGTIRVLYDSVRQWGAEAAHRVLDLAARHPWPRAVGFGLGGDESAVPARDFSDVYRRVLRMNLAPLVHAGEWAGPESVAEALRHLRPVRIAHGFRAAEDAALVRRLARLGTTLDLCLVSNAATRALPSGARHPALDLLRKGVAITLSTDDPGLFGSTLRREFERLRRLGATGTELARVLASAHAAALLPLRHRRRL